MDFFYFKSQFEALIGLFPYRAYVSHKNDGQNLTQNSSGLLKDWWLICLYFFCCLIHGRPQASIPAIFRQSAVSVRGIIIPSFK